MTPMDRLIAAADALAEASGRHLDALTRYLHEPNGYGLAEASLEAEAHLRAALTEYRAARGAVGKPTPPAHATSA